MADLSRKSTRAKLRIRRAPYWQRVSKGCYLGFRRGPDTWIARYRDRTGAQHFHALHVIEFDEAKVAAEEWFRQMGSAVSRTARRGTVREALEKYVTCLQGEGRSAAAATALDRFESIVWPDPLASIPLPSLTRDDFREWRDRLSAYEVIPCRNCKVERRLTRDDDGADTVRCTRCRAVLNTADKLVRKRQARTINRHVRAVVAGLNRAVAENHIGNPNAWTIPALADDVDDTGETAVFLDAAQRRALIAASAPDVAAFLRGLELTGARPGELAAATVAHLDAAQGTLTLSHRKGRPPKLRPRAVVLSDEGAAFFAKHARGKLPGAPLLPTAEGRPFERHEWAGAIRAAIRAHNATARGKRRIPATASAYSFRHARISELLQVHGIDPLTVAVQTGTSVKMIEKAYHRLIPDAMRDKLRAAS